MNVNMQASLPPTQTTIESTYDGKEKESFCVPTPESVE